MRVMSPHVSRFSHPPIRYIWIYNPKPSIWRKHTWDRLEGNKHWILSMFPPNAGFKRLFCGAVELSARLSWHGPFPAFKGDIPTSIRRQESSQSGIRHLAYETHKVLQTTIIRMYDKWLQKRCCNVQGIHHPRQLSVLANQAEYGILMSLLYLHA